MKLGLILLFSAIVLNIALIAILTLFRDRRLILLAFIGYLLVLLYVVGFVGRTPGMRGVNFHLPLPFLEALLRGSYDRFTNRSLLNLIAFIPFGFLLPQVLFIFSPDLHLKWIHYVLIGFVFSLLIESCQYLFQVGDFELDDLVKNSMGTAIGAVICLQLFNPAELTEEVKTTEWIAKGEKEYEENKN